MKWHIYNSDGCPLCWDGAAIEFDTKSEAQAFWDSCSMSADEEYTITKDILYYDGGYISVAEINLKNEKNNKCPYLNEKILRGEAKTCEQACENWENCTFEEMACRAKEAYYMLLERYEKLEKESKKDS